MESLCYSANKGSDDAYDVSTSLTFAACAESWVDDARWFGPHFSVRVNFGLGRWTACVSVHRTFTPVWPALWLHAHDKCRSSVNKEVQEVWAIYDERLRTTDVAASEGINAGLAAGDPTAAWAVWSGAAESALADACRLARGPLPSGGVLRLGRGRLDAYQHRKGGSQVGKVRPKRSDVWEADDVAGYYGSSLALCCGLDGGQRFALIFHLLS